MRRHFALGFTVALTLGCGEATESVNPVASRPVYGGPSPVVLANEAVTVTLRTAPFGMQVTDAKGNVLLDTLDVVPDVTGDDVHAYGPLGATHRENVIKPPFIGIEGFDHIEPIDDPWHHGASVGALSATATSASVDLFDPADVTATIHAEIELVDAEVRVRVTASDPAFGLFGQSFVLPEDEHVFGLGERYVTVDHRGRHYECWVEEGGIPQGEHAAPGPQNPGPNGPGMTHIPVPFYVSSRGYGLWVEGTYRSGFSFGAEDDKYARIYGEGPSFAYRVLVHDDPKATIAHYTSLTGRAKLPTPWAFGPRRRIDRHAMARGMPEDQALRVFHVPTTVADDATHFLPLGIDPSEEAELRAWTAQLHAGGFKADAYYNAYVSVERPETKDLAKDARAHHWFVETEDHKEFDMAVISAGPQVVATVDLTDPGAIAWYQSLLQKALDLGYDGWMLDFGEYIPPDAAMRDGRSGFEAHNAFPVDYDRAVTEYLQRVRGDDFMYFARAGFAGSQAYAPIVWSGDPAASYDDAKGLPAQVRAGINAGISGFPFWGSDISGYTCLRDPPPDKELYLRWAQFGALSPDMHDENACAGAPAGAPPKWTLWNDQETTDVYGRYALLHTRLLPYLYAAGAEAAATGLPIIRHPFLVDPGEPEAIGVEFEYHFGDALYVAPIVERGARTRSLWLPPGTWFDWWTFAASEGKSHIDRKTPLDELPLWIRAGGIVPMLDPSIETLAPGPVPGVVTPDDVRDVLDVRAGLAASAASGHFPLADGTVLDAALGGGAVQLPAGFTNAADDAELATCVRCGRIDAGPGGVKRVRLTGDGATDETLHAGGLTVRHHGESPIRVRWEVLLAP